MKKIFFFIATATFCIIVKAQLNITESQDIATITEKTFFTEKGIAETSNESVAKLVITITGYNSDIGCNPSQAQITQAFGTASTSGGCGRVQITITDQPIVTSGCHRSQTRRWDAVDPCGNAARTERTVNWKVVPTPPSITITGYTPDAGCNPTTSSINAAFGSVSAVDACGTATITYTASAVTSSGCQRSQTRSWTATDECGNHSTASRNVTWTEDTLPPRIRTTFFQPDAGCAPLLHPLDYYFSNVSITDNCSNPTVTHTDAPIVTNGCMQSLTRTYTAIDGCGNQSKASLTLFWRTDSIPPVLTISGYTPNAGCHPMPPVLEAAFGTPVASDDCSSVTITYVDDQFTSNGCNDSRRRTWTATDGCGNKTTATRTVSWVDDNKTPVFTGDYSTVQLGPSPAASDINAALGSATATDGCSAVTITSSDGAVVTNDCHRSQTRTFVARDSCNNPSTISRTVTWTVGKCTIFINIADITVLESSGVANVPVSLSEAFPSTITVKYKTVNGTARSSKDFTAVSGTLTFSAGQTLKYISIPIVVDNNNEPDETFIVDLSQPANAVIGDGSATVTITQTALPIRSNTNYITETGNSNLKWVIANPQHKSSMLTFNGIGSGNFDVILSDIQGRIVVNLKNYRNNWSMSNLDPGLYIYQLIYKNGDKQERKIGKLLIAD